MGNVRFHHETPINRKFFVNFALPTNDIYLLNEFGHSKDPERDIVHEMAHVLDNHLGGKLPASFVGGGPSEKMVKDLGGDPDRCTLKIYCPQDYTSKVAGPESRPTQAYANKGVADDFAETLVFAVFDRSKVPAQRLAWMDGFIRHTGEQLEP
jgi:hypothetical protein